MRRRAGGGHSFFRLNRSRDRLGKATGRSPPMSELHWKPAYELAAMIRRRELKAAELMTATIARLEKVNPKVNAFVALRADQAMDEARAIDEKIARREEVGPLAGL